MGRRYGVRMKKRTPRALKSKTVGLAPLDFETALRAAMQTGKAPPMPKRKKAKPKGTK